MSSAWHPFSIDPPVPVQAELFYGNLVLSDVDGNPKSAVIAPWRDERRTIGYWDGTAWHEMGTGHRINEFGDLPPNWLPTHWRALPELPM